MLENVVVKTTFKIFLTSIFVLGILIPTKTSAVSAFQVVNKVESRDVQRQEKNAKIEERKASNEARVTQVRQARIRNLWTRMKGRLYATTERIDILIFRIESRLQLIKENNEDLETAAVEEMLIEAKELLTETDILITETDGLLEDILESEDPKFAFQSFKFAVSQIKDNLKEIRRTLVDVVGDIKGLRVGQTNATITQTE